MFSFIKSFMDLQTKIFMNLNKSNDEKKIGLKKKKKQSLEQTKDLKLKFAYIMNLIIYIFWITKLLVLIKIEFS